MTNYEKTHTLAAGIAAELGDGWTYERQNNSEDTLYPWAKLGHPSGREMAISISEPWRKNEKARVEIRGHYPEYRDTDGRLTTVHPEHLYNPKADAPSITVSAEKTPAQIAKDIERRFLPWYIEVWERCKVKADEGAEYVGKRLDLRAELAAIPGVEMRGETGWYRLDKVSHRSIDLKVTSATGIELKAEGLKPAQVAAIIDLLKG